MEKFAGQPRRLGDLEGEHLSLEMWHETNAQNDGTIRRETRFPESPDDWILSGPHFFVGSPFYKTSRAVCAEKGHYDVLDLQTLPDDYLPRTNYVPACSLDTYRARTPQVPWKDEAHSSVKKVTDYYRIAYRAMIGSASERTLSCGLYPPGPAHMNGVRTYAFKNVGDLLSAYAAHLSVPFDFLLKSTGKQNLY